MTEQEKPEGASEADRTTAARDELAQIIGIFSKAKATPLPSSTAMLTMLTIAEQMGHVPRPSPTPSGAAKKRVVVGDVLTMLSECIRGISEETGVSEETDTQGETN